MQKTKKQFSFLVLFFVLMLPLFSSYRVSAQESEINQFISDHWEDDYFGEVRMEVGEETVEVDGKKDTYSNVFHHSEKQSKNIIQSEKNIKEDLKDYEIKENKDGSFTVTNPYQTKRIVIPEKTKEDYGQTDSVSDRSKTVLQYDTEEETQEAFEEIKKEYPDAYVDKILKAEDVLKDYQGISWGVNTMGMNQCKSRYSGNQKVKVAIIDTGLDTTSRLFDNRTISSDKFNFIDNSHNVQDSFNVEEPGHGTHVAGVIADATPSNVELMPLKVFDDNGNASELIVSQAIEYAVNKKADVINMSIGIEDFNASSYTFLEDSLRHAYQQNIPVFVASGNNGYDIQNSYPANKENVISVGAINNQFTIPSYSNYGDTLDFVAPGNNIKSAYIGKRSTYLSMSGTSMATPHMSAAGAYIKMINPKITWQGLYNKLKEYSVDILEKGWDSSSGWGYVDLKDLIEEEMESLEEIPEGLSFPSQTVTYNGQKQHPVIQGTLPDGYTVSYNEFTNVGTYTAKAVFYYDGDRIGEKTATFTIKPKGISEAMFTLEKTAYAYTGDKITPSIKVFSIIEAPVTQADYSINCENNVRPGTATVTITGKNNYTGTLKKSFTIAENPMSYTDKTVYYNGSDQWIEITGKPSGVKASYTKARNAGSHTVSVTLSDVNGTYKTLRATLTIKPLTLKKENFSLSKTVYNYTGKVIKPSVTSTIPSENYTVSYSNNIKVGTGSVIIQGKTNYKGSITLSFTINKPSFNSKEIQFFNKTFTYDGKSHSITVQGNIPSNAKISYSGNGKKNVGTYTVTAVIQVGNSIYYKKAIMTIAPKYLSNFTLKNTVYEYKGKNVYPTISLTGDYSKTYKNNNKPGFATVTVTGKGNYQGTIQKTFTILPKIKKLSKTKKGIQLSFYNAKTIKIYKKTGNGSWKYYKMNKKKTFLDKNVKSGKTYSYRIYQNGQMSKTVKKKY